MRVSMVEVKGASVAIGDGVFGVYRNESAQGDGGAGDNPSATAPTLEKEKFPQLGHSFLR